MKLLLKILFFILAIFCTNFSEAKVVVFDNVFAEITFFYDDLESKNDSRLISENDFGISCKSESNLLDCRDLISVVKAVAAKGGGNTFRYMTEAELKAVQNTGLLRGGRAGETFFTKDL